MNDLRNIDCMKMMAEFPDKYFDLAIVDPPYGLPNFQFALRVRQALPVIANLYLKGVAVN